MPGAEMQDDDLKFEIDGPEVHQATVDAEAALALFLSYLELVRKAAKERGADLKFHGLKVEEKCLQLGAVPSDSVAALMGARDVSAMLAREMPIPSTLSKSVTSFRKRMSNFPQRIVRSSVQVGAWERVGVEVKWTEPKVVAIRESFFGRAIVTRVGGKKPTVRLSSRIEDKEMTLDIDKEMALKIAPFLYKEVDVDARVLRDAKGMIVGGDLLDFEPVTDEDPTRVWGDFLREAGGPPSGLSLEQLNEELGRD